MHRSCISNINNTFINNADDLDIVIPMYILLNAMAIILWHQKENRNYRDKENDYGNKNNDAFDYKTNNSNKKTGKYFDYNAIIVANTPADQNTLGTVVILSKYIFNF